MALPQPNRLKKEKDFRKVFKEGKGFREGFLFFKALKKEWALIRLGFVVTNKASKKAFIRNKAKRKLAEAIRAKLPSIEKGWDGIFIISQPLTVQQLENVGETAERLLRRAGLIKKKH